MSFKGGYRPPTAELRSIDWEGGYRPPTAVTRGVPHPNGGSSAL